MRIKGIWDRISKYIWDKRWFPFLLLHLWRWTRTIFISIFLILLLIYLLFKIPVVKQWAIRNIDKALEKRLETEVTIGDLKLPFFSDKLELEQFIVEGFAKDTVIKADHLLVDFDVNPIHLFRNGITVEALDLKDAALNVKKLEGEVQSNLDVLIAKLFPKPGNRKKNNEFNLNLRLLSLSNTHYENYNEVKGKRLSIFVQKGKVLVDQVNIPGKEIWLDQLILKAPEIGVYDYQEKPLPDSLISILASDSLEVKDSAVFKFVINKVDLSEGFVSIHNYRRAQVRTSPTNELDYRHLDFSKVYLDIDSFKFDMNFNFLGRLNRFSFVENSGFEMEHVSAEYGNVTPEGFQLYGFNLKTNHSEIKDTLIFKYKKYPDFFDFNSSVKMDCKFKNSRLAIRDLLVFAKGLKKKKFFASNQNEVLNINGRFRGTMNDLEGDALELGLQDGSILKGNFTSNNLTISDEAWMYFNVDQFNTSIGTFRQLIPNLNLPENFDRLGQLRFTKGNFTGYFYDFVAYGSLATDLGYAKMDLKLSLPEGRAKAKYNGGLDLIEFDLGEWLDNKDFGLVSVVTEIKNGSGLTGETLNATLSANLESFTFRDYTYKAAQFTGQLNKYLLDGDFEIRDEHIDFSFNGKLNFLRPISEYDFKANINRIDLKNLNLFKNDLVLSGQVDLNLKQDFNYNYVTGNVKLEDWLMVADQEKEILIREFKGGSKLDTATLEKSLVIESDVIEGTVIGEFYLNELANLFKGFISTYHPATAARLNLKTKSIRPNQRFNWDFRIKDSKGINYLINKQLAPFKEVTFYGGFDGVVDTIDAWLKIPDLTFGKTRLEDIRISLDAFEGEGDFLVGVGKTILNEKTTLDPLRLTSYFYRDTALFSFLYAKSVRDETLSFKGLIYPEDTTHYAFGVADPELVVLNESWQIDPKNQSQIFKDSISVKHFNLNDRDQFRTVTISSFGKRGLNFDLQRFDFEKINEIWDYEPLDFDGYCDINLRVRDISKLEDIDVIVLSDTLYINEDDWGAFRLDAKVDDLNSRINAYMTITKDTAQLIAEGFYNLKDLTKKPQNDKDKKGNYNINLNVAGFPLKIAEYFVGSSISNTIGNFDINALISGFPGELNITGGMEARDGAVTVDYLKTRYYFDKSEITINNDLFDASNTILQDKYGNTATLYGGVSHQRLKNLGFDAYLDTEKFLAIDTKKGDNALFYGTGIGAGRIQFSGSFRQPNIYVDATVGKDTKLFIPIESEYETTQSEYIKFVDRDKENEKGKPLPPKRELLKGVSLEMELDIEEEADVEIIFDEQAGDIITGSGNGHLRILVPRTGDFKMYGDYAITKGDYLFTLYNVVNKKFLIQRGGTIQWDGDPYSAEIDIEAEYSNISASVANLIQEYLVNAPSGLQNTASVPTKVDLKMKLKGKLLQPIITFEIVMPDLTGLVETYVNNKLRLLESDQNELYKQVFGLITMGQFIPSEFDFRGAGNDIIYNTLSEFVSNQLSLLITELFAEFLEDGSVLSGIDFDINYNPNQSVDIEGQSINAGDELELRLRQDFFNDRLSIIVGGNIDLGGNLSAATNSSGAFVGNDLVIEYNISKDRSLKLKIYQRLLPDIGGGRRLQLGTGLSYRKEFDSFKDFWRSLKKDAGKK